MRKKKILIVDDDPHQIKLIEMYLSAENYKIFQARSGRGALELLQKKKFELIISDLQMPEMSGEVLYKKVREELELRTPFIFVTAFGNIEELKGKIEGDFQLFLQKPFTSKHLKESIANILA